MVSFLGGISLVIVYNNILKEIKRHEQNNTYKIINNQKFTIIKYNFYLINDKIMNTSINKTLINFDIYIYKFNSRVSYIHFIYIIINDKKGLHDLFFYPNGTKANHTFLLKRNYDISWGNLLYNIRYIKIYIIYYIIILLISSKEY